MWQTWPAVMAYRVESFTIMRVRLRCASFSTDADCIGTSLGLQAEARIELEQAIVEWLEKSPPVILSTRYKTPWRRKV